MNCTQVCADVFSGKVWSEYVPTTLQEFWNILYRVRVWIFWLAVVGICAAIGIARSSVPETRQIASAAIVTTGVFLFIAILAGRGKWKLFRQLLVPVVLISVCAFGVAWCLVHSAYAFASEKSLYFAFGIVLVVVMWVLVTWFHGTYSDCNKQAKSLCGPTSLRAVPLSFEVPVRLVSFLLLLTFFLLSFACGYAAVLMMMQGEIAGLLLFGFGALLFSLLFFLSLALCRHNWAKICLLRREAKD